MTTLITWQTSSGHQGRCDAHCHNAASPAAKCRCLCGGIYHGGARDGTLEARIQANLRHIKQRVQHEATKRGVPSDPNSIQIKPF